MHKDDDRFKGLRLVVGKDGGFSIADDGEELESRPKANAEAIERAEAELLGRWEEMQEAVQEGVVHMICYLRGRLGIDTVLMNTTVLIESQPGVGIEIKASTYNEDETGLIREYPDLSGETEI